MTNIAVLITCHNRINQTLLCLNNLYKQDYINIYFKISTFLVDDGSSDGTFDSIIKCYPQVNITKGDGFLFWNRGMNLAWANSINSNLTFDFFLWLNDDVLLFNNSINNLLNCYKLNNQLNIICGSCCDHNKNFTYGLLDKNFQQVYQDNNDNKMKFMNGNCVLISKEVFSKIGMLDSYYLHAIGDYDYGLRAQKNNINIIPSNDFIGYCLLNKKELIWQSSNFSFYKRLKDLYSDTSYSQPYRLFHFNYRHFGIFIAIRVFFTNHLIVFFPFLKKNRN